MEILEVETTQLTSTVSELTVTSEEQETRIQALESAVNGNCDVLLPKVVKEMGFRSSTDFLRRRIAQNCFLLTGPWDSCVSSPCENGATCVDVNVDRFICVCRDGYFGVTCGESEKRREKRTQSEFCEMQKSGSHL